MTAPRRVSVPTPHGPAEVEVRGVRSARAALLLGHGAGGSTSAPDLQAVAEVAVAHRVSVGLVTQPYRVAGKRSTPRPPVLDEAWMEVVRHAAARTRGAFHGLPLIFGGRSSGARVACRCARPGGAVGVLALAFPLVPPQRAGSDQVPASRLPELDGAGVPVLVVQGERDRFGVPRASKASRREVVRIRGDHGLKADHDRLRAAVADWLERVLAL